MLRFYWFALAVLGVWRLTYMLEAEDGPWDLVLRLRRRMGDGLWGRLMDCFYCLSLWIAIPFAYFIGEGVGEMLLLWPALSGGAILLHRATGNRVTEKGRQMPFYYEDEGVDDGMLRQPETEPLQFEQESPEADDIGPEN